MPHSIPSREAVWRARTPVPYGAILALDPENANLKWELRTKNPLNVGVLTTRGNFAVFRHGAADCFALNATTGELLRRFRANGELNAAPFTFAGDGRQYVAVPIGQALFVFELIGI